MSLDIDTIRSWYEDGKLTEVMDAVRADPSLLNRRDSYHWTLLNHAAGRGDRQTVVALLALEANADAQDDGCTPLISAIQSSSPKAIEIARLLLEHGANVNASMHEGDSALHAAVRSGSIDKVDLLLKNGADINVRAWPDEETPLWCAAFRANEPMVRFLLDRGASPWLKDTVLGTPLDVARRHAAQEPENQAYRNIIELVDKTMAQQASEALAHKEVGSPELHPHVVDLYLYGGATEVLEAAREDRSLLTFREGNGPTLLNCAAYRGDRDTVVELLALGASADTDDPRYVPPLISAIASAGSSYTMEIMELLLRSGANINRVCHGDCSPISYAMMLKEPEIIEFLLEHGADINLLTPANKQRILQSAAAGGDEQMVRRALDLGADPQVEDDVSGTPLEVARRYVEESDGHRRIVRLLEDWVAEQSQRRPER